MNKELEAVHRLRENWTLKVKTGNHHMLQNNCEKWALKISP